MGHLKRWLPVVAWSAVILATSNDWFSAAHTGSWLGVSETVNVVLRKLAHLTGYGILGVLALRASRRALPLTYAIVLLVASLDEWNQSFIPSRGGSPWDVLLDVVGATLAIGMMFGVQQLRSRRRNR
jgi:VanZ family protein